MSASPALVPISRQQLGFPFVALPRGFGKAIVELKLSGLDAAYLFKIQQETYGANRQEFAAKRTDQELASELRTSVSYLRESREKLQRFKLIRPDRTGPHRHKRGYRLELPTFENLPKLPEPKRKKRHQARTLPAPIAARLECPLQQVRAAGLSCPVDKLYQVGGLLSNLEPSPGPASGGAAGVGRKKPVGSEQQAKKTTATAADSKQVLLSHALPDASPELPGADPLAGNGEGVLESKVGSEEKAKKTTATAVDSKQLLSIQQFTAMLYAWILRTFVEGGLLKAVPDRDLLARIAKVLGCQHFDEFRRMVETRVEKLGGIRGGGLFEVLAKEFRENQELEAIQVDLPESGLAHRLKLKRQLDEESRHDAREAENRRYLRGKRLQQEIEKLRRGET